MKKLILALALLSLFMTGCATVVAVEQGTAVEMEEYDSNRISPSTLEEISDFLVKDKVDTYLFMPNAYDCKYFSADLWRHAYKQGIEAFMVTFIPERSALRQKLAELTYEASVVYHMVVGFKLVDGSKVYVEPQSDEFIEIDAEIKQIIEGEDAFNYWKLLRVNQGQQES